MVSAKSRLISVFAAKDGETLYNQQNKTGSCLWLRSLTSYSKFGLKSKTVGKTTRAFRYNLNQIPYDYTVEVTNRFKGSDLIDKSA